MVIARLSLSFVVFVDKKERKKWLLGTRDNVLLVPATNKYGFQDHKNKKLTWAMRINFSTTLTRC
jgi:hypothetical protein